MHLMIYVQLAFNRIAQDALNYLTMLEINLEAKVTIFFALPFARSPILSKSCEIRKALMATLKSIAIGALFTSNSHNLGVNFCSILIDFFIALDNPDLPPLYLK